MTNREEAERVAGELGAEERRALIDLAADNPPGSEFVIVPGDMPRAFIRLGLFNSTIAFPRDRLRKPAGLTPLGRDVAAILKERENGGR